MIDVLEMRNITKKFPGVKALDNVSLRIKPCEIHSIVGENGAGKSTLMKILSGVYKKDEGEILIKGKEVDIKSPQSAIDHGIGIVYQNLDLIPSLSVAENIFLNQKPMKGFYIHKAQMEDKAVEILKKLNCKIHPATLVGSLSVADQQMIAIARVLSRKISILILDEPTSSLSPAEAEKLFENVRNLKENGVSIIFISHHMDEIFQISNHVTVLCDGKLVGDKPIEDLTEKDLVKMMIGREVNESLSKKLTTVGETLLEVKNLSVGKYVHDISFSLKKGEVLGIGGLVGAGRSWLVKSIFGAVKGRRGEILIDGKKVKIRKSQDAVNLGIAFIPEDRRLEGMVDEMTISENVSLCNFDEVARYGIIRKSREKALSKKIVSEMDVKTPTINQYVKNLSGGNQQKIVLGKWFNRSPRIMIFDEPTRGIDVGAKSEIHRKICELASEGIGVIMISSELPELMDISDRIVVMSKGYKTAEFERGNFVAEDIMLAATSEKK